MKKYDLTYVTNEMPHGLSIKQIESLVDKVENLRRYEKNIRSKLSEITKTTILGEYENFNVRLFNKYKVGQLEGSGMWGTHMSDFLLSVKYNKKLIVSLYEKISCSYGGGSSVTPDHRGGFLELLFFDLSNRIDEKKEKSKCQVSQEELDKIRKLL